MKNEEIEYAVNISHEFKNPVTSLNLLLETLYEYDDNLQKCKRKELIELSLKEIVRLKDLITCFLYIKEEIKSDCINKEEEKFPNLLKDENLSFNTLYIYKNSFIKSYLYGVENAAIILINKKLYYHIISNLLGNANKFIRRQGWIILEADILASISLASFTYEKCARSSIIDNGVGFTDSISIFIKSKDPNSYLSKRGIGLNIIKKSLLFHDLFLNGISYPSRGAKLFFDIQPLYKINNSK